MRVPLKLRLRDIGMTFKEEASKCSVPAQLTKMSDWVARSAQLPAGEVRSRQRHDIVRSWEGEGAR